MDQLMAYPAFLVREKATRKLIGLVIAGDTLDLISTLQADLDLETIEPGQFEYIGMLEGAIYMNCELGQFDEDYKEYDYGDALEKAEQSSDLDDVLTEAANYHVSKDPKDYFWVDLPSSKEAEAELENLGLNLSMDSIRRTLH